VTAVTGPVLLEVDAFNNTRLPLPVGVEATQCEAYSSVLVLYCALADIGFYPKGFR